MKNLSAVLGLGLAIVLCLTLAACKQRAESVFPVDFTGLLRRFKQQGMGDTLLPPPVIYRRSTFQEGQLQFELLLAPKSLGLRHQVVQRRDHSYPVSYSVVFKGCLVALFKNGKFGCYKLSDFTADQQLERVLNARSWKRHWLINQQLVAQSDRHYFVFAEATRTWQPYHQPVPFGARPKLYEDARYLAYSDCEGEWGGTIYFFNKATHQVHRANATCATSVWQQGRQYWLLASLGHNEGSARCATIADPEVLPLVSTRRDDKVDWQYDFKLPENGVKPFFDFYGIQLFGGFRRQNQTLYLMHWRNTTFLVTIDGKQITIVDPLFANDLYTHEPVTTSYGPKLALTNLDFYSLGGSDEVAALLWQGQQVTKIEWGEQPADMK